MARALVLGGGGPVGIAWESGLVAGLAQGGVDVGQADFTLGTSAGSFVGARLALGADAKTFADPILADQIPGDERRPAGGGGPPPDLTPLMRLMGEAQGGTRNPAEVRQEIGAFALAAPTMDEAAFLETFGRSFSTLRVDAWPERGFACTAVDAETGGFQLWTRDSGVGVVRAVASSCSVPGVYPPVTLNGRRYIDGGMRSSTNADMAGGHELVLVVAVRLGAAGGALGERIAARFNEEVESLKDGGATVVTITPDEDSVTAFGPNLMDFRRRPDAARAGLAQGLAYAADVKPYWDRLA
ncbi:MAG: patatin-like phospholipase family protein [Phenylobacterium sp.]